MGAGQSKSSEDDKVFYTETPIQVSLLHFLKPFRLLRIDCGVVLGRGGESPHRPSGFPRTFP